MNPLNWTVGQLLGTLTALVTLTTTNELQVAVTLVLP
jgi:hypothetical protein